MPLSYEVAVEALRDLSNPFYDTGPNDEGIANQIGHAICCLMTGYLLAALIATPLGFLIGMQKP